jgi:hypothetical protein
MVSAIETQCVHIAWIRFNPWVSKPTYESKAVRRGVRRLHLRLRGAQRDHHTGPVVYQHHGRADAPDPYLKAVTFNL